MEIVKNTIILLCILGGASVFYPTAIISAVAIALTYALLTYTATKIFNYFYKRKFG